MRAQSRLQWLKLDNSHIARANETAKIAQIALRFGADDLDGTVIEEKIYHDAGATTPQGMRRQELMRLITEAGREPIERDTLYRPVTRTETSFTVAV
jgi:aminodeoxyfutalosine synthase